MKAPTKLAPSKAKVTVVPVADVVETFDCEQGSEEWYRLRLGICTASNFATIMATGADGESKTRKKLLYQMAGEILTNEPAENYSNQYMQRGKDMEQEARSFYAFTRGVEVEQVGFVRRVMKDALYGERVVGASPDSLVGADKVLEIKTMAPHLLIDLLESGRFPTEHRAQCQGSLWVTGRSVCHLLIFYRGMPVAPTFTVERDDVYIRKIQDAVEAFQYELGKLVERTKARGR